MRSAGDRSAVVARVLGVLASASLVGGCFNSDEVFKIAPAVTTDGPDTTTSPTTTTATTSDDDDTTTGGPMGDKTCRDAITCVQSCIFELALSNLPEPDLSCFLDCTQALSEQEALKLLRLGNCVSGECSNLGYCATPGEDTGSTDDGGSSTGDEGDSSTSGGESSSSGGESSSSGGEGSSTSGASSSSGGGNSSGGGSSDGLVDPCLLCILNGMTDPEPAGCMEFADACRGK